MEQTSSANQEQQLLLIQNRHALEAKAKGGINWFFWIGGLSILNTITYLMGESLTFVVGLGATQFIDGFFSGFVEDTGPLLLVYAVWVIFDVLLSGFFIGAGFLGRGGHRWAVITGIVLYTLDAILLVIFRSWLGVVFHVLALAGLFGGLIALTNLKKLDQPPSNPSVPVLP